MVRFGAFWVLLFYSSLPDVTMAISWGLGRPLYTLRFLQSEGAVKTSEGPAIRGFHVVRTHVVQAASGNNVTPHSDSINETALDFFAAQVQSLKIF